MTKYLLLIHIGPMQTFIAAARRTRDLWFGSWLMSELSKATAWRVAELAGADALIFPATSFSLDELKPGSGLSAANKIVAIVEEPANVARKAKKAMQERLDTLAEIALDGAKGVLNTREVAKEQIKDLPEFYWVAVPLPDEKDYPQVRLKAENLLAARKNLRHFGQPTWGSNRPKSSLDGKRESVIPESAYPNRDDSKEEREKKVRQLFINYGARNGERLSGVDLLKRLGKANRRQSFPSTSHMATMPLKAHLQARVNDSTVQQKWRDYLTALRKKNADIEKQEVIRHDLQLPILGKLDGGLLFKSRLLDFMDKAEARSVESKLQAFLKELLRDAKVKELIPYYALLVGDGDFMGRTINNQETADAHRAFSQALAGFAQEAETIVKNHQGAAVYAGGDDVMALLPIHKAIQCAAELAETFQVKMADFTDKKGNPPTFSAGIAIFHHTEPLEDALQTARAAEQTAKSVPGKNALAVTEAKRSGAPRTVTGKWKFKSSDQPESKGQDKSACKQLPGLNQRLLKLAKLYQQDALPTGLAYQLRDLYLHLGIEEIIRTYKSVKPNSDKLEARKRLLELVEVLKVESSRIVGRKESSKGAQNYVGNCLLKELHYLDDIDEGDEKGKESSRKKAVYTIEQLVNELIIATNLAKAADQAGEMLPLPPKENE